MTIRHYHLQHPQSTQNISLHSYSPIFLPTRPHSSLFPQQPQRLHTYLLGQCLLLPHRKRYLPPLQCLPSIYPFLTRGCWWSLPSHSFRISLLPASPQQHEPRLFLAINSRQSLQPRSSSEVWRNLWSRPSTPANTCHRLLNPSRTPTCSCQTFQQ